MIERKDEGPVAVLSIAHGPVNVMDLELLLAITEAFTDLADDPARAVVLTGVGRAFSAGVDLNRILAGGHDYVAEFMPALTEALMAVFTFERPVIAAVNGHAIAGGAVLALAADHRVMTNGKGAIGTPEALVGVAFPRAALDIVVYAVGEITGRKMIIGTENLPPEQALALGVVDELAEPESVVSRAVEVAAGLADKIPADTFAHTKLQLRRHIIERVVNYGQDEDARATQVWQTRATDGWMADYLARTTRKK
ncbi:MAG TPA: enoyl-CoA hydratase/isomerase family protein [Pseudonocardia sp.]|jgi:enoyl-CoA hydratase